jgi:hypothetical protein
VEAVLLENIFPLMYEQSVERLHELLDIIRKKIKKQKEKEL